MGHTTKWDVKVNMATILKTKSIYYNDCNLIAQPTHENLKSRSDIPIELHRIIVSPMDAIVGETFASEATRIGLSVCTHRFCDISKQLDVFKSTIHFKNKSSGKVFVSIGLDDWDRVSTFKDYTSDWIIDCANGYLSEIKKVISRLSNEASIHNLIVGNVHTADGIELYKNLKDWKLNLLIRVGIAGGSPCSTSDATGYNRGQITEIMECSTACEKYDRFNVVADGGIKNGNYAVKAFGAGAEFCMMGGYFSKSLEAETHIIGDGNYWGGASHKQQERCGIIKKHSEGKSFMVNEELKPLSVLVDELWGGISSGVSYSGKKSLTDFVGNGVFEIKQNSLAPTNRR